MKFWIPLTIILLAMAIALVNLFVFRPIPKPYLQATLNKPSSIFLIRQASPLMNHYEAIKANNPEEADHLLQHIVYLYPNYLPARTALAQKYEEEGNLYEAYQHYSAILQTSPLDKAIKYKVAALEVKLGDYADAKNSLKDLALSTKGKMHALAKEQRLLTVKDEKILQTKINQYQLLKKTNDDDAFKFIQQLAIQYPLNLSVQQMMAEHALERSNIDQALYYFDRAQALEPENTEIAFARGKVYYTQNDFAKALVALRLSSNSVDPATRAESETLLIEIHNINAQKDKGL